MGGVQVAQAVLPGPVPLPMAGIVMLDAVPPSFERSVGQALDQASRRLQYMGAEIARGDLLDKGGHAFLGQPFPPEVDDPSSLALATLDRRSNAPLSITVMPPPDPGRATLTDAQGRLMGRPEMFPAEHGTPDFREGVSLPPAATPSTTAHPMPAPAGPDIVTTVNLGSVDQPRSEGLPDRATMAALLGR